MSSVVWNMAVAGDEDLSLGARARVLAPSSVQTPPGDDALALRDHFSSIRM
jgi:hypothetical protein